MQRTALRAAAGAEPSRAGLFGGHDVRKWLPANHRRRKLGGQCSDWTEETLAKCLYKAL